MCAQSPRKLEWCGNCQEKSVVIECRVREKDGAYVRYEYCINKNPDCQYRAAIVLEEGNKDESPAKETSPAQLELFPEFIK